MTLREKRILFTELVAHLILQAGSLGLEPALGEVVRGKQQAEWNAKSGTGISNSLHLCGLAVDLLLYRNGTYLIHTEDYRELGEWWEKQHELCRWGGRFNDGNHYSIEHEGIK